MMLGGGSYAMGLRRSSDQTVHGVREGVKEWRTRATERTRRVPLRTAGDVTNR